VIDIMNFGSQSTLRAYQDDWKHFSAWCLEHEYDTLPAGPDVVAAYIADLGKSFKMSTIERRLVSISRAHKGAGLPNPASRKLDVVGAMFWRVRCERGVGRTKKTAILKENLRACIDALPDSLHGLRDKALLLLGYVTALRRSELVALDVADVAFTGEGMRLTIRRSKNDQRGKGVTHNVSFYATAERCPVRALREWLDCSGIESGPIFRPINRHGQLQSSRLSGTAVGLIIKRLAPLLGVDPAAVGGHSLRVGMVVDCLRAGMSPNQIVLRTGHKHARGILDYCRDSEQLRIMDVATAVQL
jgi:integrase